jgi:hypothetical protein
MKTLLALFVLSFCALTPSLAQRASVSNGGAVAPDLSKVVGFPTGPRHVEGTIKGISGEGALLEVDGFYDFAPDAKIAPPDPQGDALARKRGTIYVPPLQQGWKSGVGLIFVRGLGKGFADWQQWQGMLEPDGTKTHQTEIGGRKTVRVFKLSTASDPVAAYFAALKK